MADQLGTPDTSPASVKDIDSKVSSLPKVTSARLSTGQTLAWRDSDPSGNKPALILIHGFAASGGLNWADAFDVLGGTLRVITPDMPGHAHTPFERKNFTFDDAADDLAALIDYLNLEKPLLGGFSMGGMIAQHFGRRHGETVKGLIFSGCDHGSRKYGMFKQAAARPITGAMIRFMQMITSALFAKRLREQQQGAEYGPKSDGAKRWAWAASELRGHDPSGIAAANIAVMNFNSGPWLREIDTPVAVLATLQDNLFPIAEQRKMAQMITDARLYEFNGGHLASNKTPYLEKLMVVAEDLLSR